MIKQLEKYINEHKNDNIVIGIDGPSGAGKTSLVEELEKQFDITVFHVDDYFLPADRKSPNRLREPGGNFDYERMEKEVFHHINDDFIQSNKYNCKTACYEMKTALERKRIVVVEGVYALHPKFIPYYNYTVFLDIDRPLQLKRILSRSNNTMLERFKNEFIPLEDLYFDSLSVRNRVNLLVKN